MATYPTDSTHPRIHGWLLAEGLNNTEAGELIGASREAVRRWRLPFSDPKRQTPGADDIEKWLDATKGAVTAEDWYPPHLRRSNLRGGNPAVLRLARAL